MHREVSERPLAYRGLYSDVRGGKQTRERGGALLGAQPRPPDAPVVTRAPLSVSHGMRFRGPPANLWTLFSLPNTRAGQSPFDPSGAADAATRSPPSPSPPLLAGSLQENPLQDSH